MTNKKEKIVERQAGYGGFKAPEKPTPRYCPSGVRLRTYRRCGYGGFRAPSAPIPRLCPGRNRTLH